MNSNLYQNDVVDMYQIEIVRKELETLAEEHNFNFQNEFVIQKSVELDRLLNRYNKPST
ncbi:Spo0E like sporulation regulatory protein [Paenibacillus sp. RU5A]|nr:aspartyl-phosphate phosphatase Spo0E family protein [Paenibacillus tundrae]SLK15990.1 Spo0E like sporulation regulatory protein [Paenibacillus sp. RU5A]SOC74152.1 Spo0E like sporulation regulatory protein [Paenibacillus sp. RU26A]SOC76302.1 Spo0E like sporulation regulatory protein [Paenibacillus sp. RU5M]